MEDPNVYNGYGTDGQYGKCSSAQDVERMLTGVADLRTALL